MYSLKLPRTLILSTHDWCQIFKKKQHLSLNKKTFHDYDYIVGPYNIKNIHWLAVLVSIKSKTFMVLDPKGNSKSFHLNYFESWKQYYNQRYDSNIQEWHHDIRNYQHPRQSSSDNYNCGVFVSLFIQHFVTYNEVINFKSSKKDMKNYRDLIAQILEDNKSL